MKRLGSMVLAVFALLLLAAPAAPAEQKIAYANLQRALNECDAGNRAKESLKDEAKKLEDELDAEQGDLKKIKEDIDKKKTVWNPETLKSKEEEFRTRSEEFQRKFMEYNDRLNEKKIEKEAKIIEELRDVVGEIARKKGYSYVFEISAGGIIYSPPEADLTDEVIKGHNEKFK